MTGATSDAVATTGTRQSKHHRRPNTRGISSLMYASQQGDVERVRKIIREQSDALSKRDRTGKTSLHYCCTSDNICAAQAADLLVMAAPDLVETHDEEGFTPLHLAVIAGNISLVTFLLANNADVNAVDNEKHTVVHWATVCGETAALRAVLAAGAPVSTPDIHGGYPLHYAAQMCGGDKDSSLGLQVLQTLLTHSDTVVSVQDGDGRQPLLWAASAGSAKAVLALIRAGAAVESPDKDGLTALHCAASRGHTDCIDSLLTLCGASPDVIDSNGCTALHYAVTLGHADATALLLAHGADPNRQDRKGRSPAHCGCAKGQFETVKMIGAQGANLWLRNARGDLPLHEAAGSGRRDLVRWLLDMRPSQVNARNNDGRCPLHLAALNDNVDMCKILLDAGAQINPILRTSKNTFMTPLDCALQRGFRSTAKYLQLHGGVPANRLSDSRYSHISSGVNLQIKEDVTFWGDTSSDSERENGERVRHNKKIQRKKISSKFEKKKASLSGSDRENGKSVSGKLESVRNKRKLSEKNQRVKTGGRTDNSLVNDQSKRTNSRKAPSGRFDYTNEIVINGKTEINIHQTKDITIAKEEQTSNQYQNKLGEVDDRKINEIAGEKDKRPKSAKHAKHQLGKAKEDVNYIKTKTEESDLRRNSEEVVDEKAAPKSDSKSVEEVHSKAVKDQQSLISDTNEDVDDKKKFIVEAAIHEPPKSESQIQEALAKSETEIVVTEEHVPKLLESKSVQTSKTEEDNENILKEECLQKDNEKNEANVEIIKPALEAIEIETKCLDNQNDEGPFDETTEETLQPVQDQPLVTKDSNTEETVTKTIEELEVPIVEEKKIEDIESETQPIIEQQTVDQEQVTGEENTQKLNEITNQEDILEEQLKSEDERKTEDLIPKFESNHSIEEQAEEEKEISTENREKLDETQTKAENEESEDQAYEIIYKTMGKDDDDEETAAELLSSKTCKPKRPKEKLRTQKKISISKSSDEEYSSSVDNDTSTSTSATVKEHKSFRILDEEEAKQIENLKAKSTKVSKKGRAPLKKERSRSEENKTDRDSERVKKSKIPLAKSHLSKSDKYLNIPDRKSKSSMESRVPSLPNINQNQERGKEHHRSESNMSAPLLASISDNEKASDSEFEEEEEERSSAVKKRRIKRRSKTREARSAGSDYESSNVIDSGFEPSPRSSRIPKWRNMSERGVNMTSVTQSIQSNIRRYHLERKIFQHLLDLKRMQIRAGQHNEAILVKRAIDNYHQSCASTVGAGRYVPEDYSFKSFEKFLYLSLRKLQKNGVEYLKGLPESPSNPLLCTQSTHRCMHATHAYTGIPCAAYLPKMDHHTIPKIGFTSTQCKPGTGFLPTINPKKTVTLELCHGNDKQVISLPADRLDQNKRYYVTFTVKGSENTPPNEETTTTTSGHRHSKSD